MRKDAVTPLDEARISFLHATFGGRIFRLEPEQYACWARLGIGRKSDIDRLLNIMARRGEAVFTIAKLYVAVQITGAQK